MTLLAGLACGTWSLHASDAAPTGESIARAGMVRALQGDFQELSRIRRLASHLLPAGNRDGERQPLPDQLGLLCAWIAPTPAERQRTLTPLAESGVKPEVRREARDALMRETAERLRRLRREDNYNRAIHAFNLPVQMAFALLTVDFQSIYDTAVALLFVWEPLSQVSPREREYLALCERRADETEHPDSGPPPSGMDRIRKRLAALQAREMLAEAQWHFGNSRWEEARRSYAKVLELQPDNTAAGEGRLEAAKRAAQEKRMREKSLEILPVPSAGLSPSLPGSDPHGKAPPISPVPNPRLCGSPAVREGKAALTKAEARRRSDLLAYTFFGTAADPDYPPRLPSQTPLHRFARSVNLLLPFQWLLRGAAATFGNPVPDDAWRGAAVRYLERGPLAQANEKQTGGWRLQAVGTETEEPEAPSLQPKASSLKPTAYSLQPAACSLQPTASDRKEVALRLAASYERIGWFNEARLWHTYALGRDDPQYASSLDEKAAKRLLENARDIEDPRQRRALLQQIALRFVRTKAAGKARGLLEKMDKEQTDWTRVSKQELLSWPDLWRGKALRLDPAWLDGEKHNGEIHKDGVRIAPDEKAFQFSLRTPGGKKFLSFLRTPGGKEEVRRQPGAPQRAEILRELKAWRRELAARRRAESLFGKRLPPLAIEGAAGLEGLDVAPRLMPLPPDPETLPLYLPATE